MHPGAAASVTTACGTPAWRSSHAATREPSSPGASLRHERVDRAPGVVERLDRGQRRPELAAAHRARAPGHEHAQRVARAARQRREHVAHQRAVVVGGLADDPLRLGAQRRRDRRRRRRLAPSVVEQRQHPVQRRGHRRGPGAREAQGVGGAADRGPTGERPRRPRPARRRSPASPRPPAPATAAPDQRAVVDRADGVGRPAHLEVHEHVREPALVHDPAHVAVPAEGRPPARRSRHPARRPGIEAWPRRRPRSAASPRRPPSEAPARPPRTLLEHLRRAHHRTPRT